MVLEVATSYVRANSEVKARVRRGWGRIGGLVGVLWDVLGSGRQINFAPRAAGWLTAVWVA